MRRVLDAVGAVAAVTAAAGAVNVVSAWRRPALGPAIEADRFDYDWDGGRVAYYRSGTGAPVLLLHSHNAAASAREMRGLFEALRGGYEVWAPDLPGYGLSERRAREYQAHTYIRFLHDFVHDAVGRPAIVVASSVTGAQALVAIDEDAHAFSHLVCVSPTGLSDRSIEPPPAIRLLGAIVRTPLWGQTAWLALSSRRYVTWTLRNQVYHIAERLAASDADYAWRSARQPNASHAPASFLAGDLWLDCRPEYAEVRRPLMLVWGEQDRFNPIEGSRSALALNPDARTEVVQDAGSAPHEERPDAVAALLESFLRDHPY